jgi:hypothetical protein
MVIKMIFLKFLKNDNKNDDDFFNVLSVYSGALIIMTTIAIKSTSIFVGTIVFIIHWLILTICLRILQIMFHVGDDTEAIIKILNKDYNNIINICKYFKRQLNN